MKTFKTQLLAATAAAASFANAAYAQIPLNPSELHGAGASSIANITPQEFNCVGQPNFNYSGTAVTNPTGLNQLGIGSSGALSTKAPFQYLGTPTRDCGAVEIQPDVQGRYISTGSGSGITWFTTMIKPTSVLNPFPNPAVAGPAGEPWTVATANTSGVGNSDYGSLQFAFSDGALSVANFATYNAVNAVGITPANVGGAPIQVPFHLLPVAVAYNPAYLTKRVANNGNAADFVTATFHLGHPRSDGSGGLRLKKSTYCGILNGTITNWNDAAITADNNASLQDTTNDTAARWSSVGAPIRLVGRADKSGTTEIVMDSIRAQCNSILGKSTNRYDVVAQALPYDKATEADLSTLPGNGSTPFKGTASTDTFAGTPATAAADGGTFVKTISGAYYDKVAGAINTTKGVETAGQFLVAQGNDGVAGAINYQPVPTNIGDIVLNGKVGFVGADFVKPSTLAGTNLNSADLEVGRSYDLPATAGFAGPTAPNAIKAFGTIAPPAASGDTRIVPASYANTASHNATRTDPMDWVAVTRLPDPIASNTAGNSLIADPALGYPITGTTQILLYTCYASAADRFAIAEFVGIMAGKVTKDSVGVTFAKTLFNGSKTTGLGVGASNGIAPMPATWLTAINDSFLKTNTYGTWIQSKLPTTTLTGITGNTSACTGKTGA